MGNEKMQFTKKIASNGRSWKIYKKNETSEINEYNKNDSFIPSPILSEKMKMIKSY